MCATMPRALVTLRDIERARDVIDNRLHRTPTVPSTYLSERCGARVSLKLELFQRTGSFKPRGVLNALSALGADERRRGVISLSAGNHAQALAWGAKSLGIHATIVMPQAAERSKIEATRAYGGEVVLTDQDLLIACRQLQHERRLTLVHPFDDPLIIAGQGTVGLELVEDLPDVDLVLVACGGGGLLAGVAAAVKALRPGARVIGVEPEGANAMTRSLERGEPVSLERLDTVADGLAAPFAGRLTLAHVKALVDAMLVVPDSDIISALGVLLERCKVAAEPAGAAAVAPLLSGALAPDPGLHVAAVVCGGNIDRERLKALL
ncbi:MAG: threonine ammonia-lyase [Gemmatimonadaceae bacterium]